MHALPGGSFGGVKAEKVKAGRLPANTLKIDVDRLGVVALDSTAMLLEQLPLRRAEAVKPSTILFQCSHLVSSAAPVTPTFPAYHPSDKRLRQADRLRAGEAIVKALVRHVKCNDAISVLEVNNAPLRLFDWQRLGAGLRTNGCPLRSLSLQGSRLGDAGLAVLGPALVAHPTLNSLNLNGCELTTASCEWLILILKKSNIIQDAGRARREFRVWANGLRGRDEPKRWRVRYVRRRAGWRGASDSGPYIPEGPDARPGQLEEDDEEESLGLEALHLAGNDLGEAGALALANHLMLNRWLCELDLRRNGIGLGGLAALRETSETERFLTVPMLKLSVEGNAQELIELEERMAAAKAALGPAPHFSRHAGDKTAEQRRQERPHSARAAPAAYYAVRGHTTSPPRVVIRSKRNSLEAEAAKLRKRLVSKQQAARAKAIRVERTLKGARVAGAVAKLDQEDWQDLTDVAGGPDKLLDAMEGLLGELVPKEEMTAAEAAHAKHVAEAATAEATAASSTSQSAAAGSSTDPLPTVPERELNVRMPSAPSLRAELPS